MVAQTVHVPVLKTLPDRFELAALCDISPGLARRVAAGAGVAAYADHREMLAKESLDLVAVVNSDEYHADCAVDALDAGCHVLVEKPAALNVADVERMIAAREKAGRIAMVGYMRRFAGAYRRMREELGDKPSILHVAVRDIIGPNSYFLDQTARVDTADDIPASAREEREARAKAQVSAAIGDAPAAHVGAYRLLCGLGSHDLGALQGLVGDPGRVIGAAQKSNGRWVTAILDYGSFLGTFEMGLDQVGDFDAYIEIFTGNRRLRLDYDTPFIKHLPIVLSVK
jgi:predicted dehydrogenase